MPPNPTQPAAVKPSAWLIGACLLAVYIVWGTTYFAIKVAIEGIAPFFLVGTRFIVAGVLLLGWQTLRGAPMPTARQWRGAALVGFLLLGGWQRRRVGRGTLGQFRRDSGADQHHAAGNRALVRRLRRLAATRRMDRHCARRCGRRDHAAWAAICREACRHLLILFGTISWSWVRCCPAGWTFRMGPPDSARKC